MQIFFSEMSSFKTNLNHIKLHKNKDFFNIGMPCEDTKILEFNLESLIEKLGVCKANPQNSSTKKVGEHLHQFLNVYNIIN